MLSDATAWTAACQSVRRVRVIPPAAVSSSPFFLLLVPRRQQISQHHEQFQQFPVFVAAFFRLARCAHFSISFADIIVSGDRTPAKTPNHRRVPRKSQLGNASLVVPPAHQQGRTPAAYLSNHLQHISRRAAQTSSVALSSDRRCTPVERVLRWILRARNAAQHDSSSSSSPSYRGQ